MQDNRIKICLIRISNFRSIKNETIAPLDFNILVGLNDAGKSNVLKALNLFFNGETDYKTPFSFQKDFTLFYDEKSHRAKEITIEIKFHIPSTYSGSGEYLWKKVWKWDGNTESIITDSNGQKPASKSRIPGALNRIKFRYVPAVKSKEYFKTLLEDLYTAVFSSLTNPLDSSIDSFSKELKEYTQDLSKDIEKQLSISSLLSFPENLNEVFKALIFETTTSDRKIKVPLTSRGDGIQASHIPIVLKYIAHEDRKSRQRGSMNVFTIWGFEEPENGLELSKTFNMANEFEEYAKEIQIFVSTHSPAFYTKRELPCSKIFYVSKKGSSDETSINEKIDNNVIADKMGLLPIVAPYIKEKSDLLNEYKRMIDRGVLADIPTIMVEGKYDDLYLRLGISLFSEHLQKQLNDGNLKIIFREGTGGCKTLSEWIIAWSYCGFKSKMMAIFDKDLAGTQAKREVEANEHYKNKKVNLHISLKHIVPTTTIADLYQKDIHLSFEIEHLLSIPFWKILISKGFVKERTNNEITECFSNQIKRIDLSIADQIKNLVDDDTFETIIKYNVDDNKKDKVYKLVLKSENKNEILDGLKPTIELIERFFCK